MQQHYDPSPCAKRLDGAAAGERSDEPNTNNEGEIRRNLDRPIQSSAYGRAAGPTVYQYPNSGLYLVPDQRQTGGNGKAHRKGSAVY